MNRYSIAIPRAAFGLVAVAMTALTLAVGVVMPATLGSLSDGSRVLAAAEGVAARAEAGANRLRIDVVAEREQATAYAPVRQALPKNKQQS